MGTRRYTHYTQPGADPHKIGRFPRGPIDGELLNAAVVNYAETRRNQLCIVHNVPRTLTWDSEDDLGWRLWFKVPIGNRIVRQGKACKLKIWVHAETTSELVANTVRLKFQIGTAESGEVTVLSLTKAWSSTEIDLSDVHVSGYEWMRVLHNCDAGNTVTVHTISIYQPGDDTVTYLDANFANCKLGDPDYPDSTLARKILRDDVVAVRDHKTMRNNVFNHFFGDYMKQGTAYGAGNDDLGAYKVVKRAGIETVKVYFLACKGIGDADWTCRIEFDGTGNEVAVSATTPTWYETTFTMVGADITNEVATELKFDGKEAGLAFMYLPAFICLEVPAGAIAHTVPDSLDAQLPSPILASTWDSARTTMSHLYERGGASIICSDYRTGDYSYGHVLYCTATAFDKTDIGYANSSTVARCMVFPSTQVQHVRVSMGFHSVDNGGAARVKHITLQISDNMAFATWDDVHHLYENNTEGAYQFTHDVDEDDEEIISCELDVNSVDWETYGTGVPLQIWVSAKTDNADEYVMPHWVSVEEVVLREDDFP